MAVGFVASATSGSQASVATFNIGTLGTGARAGIVFVCIHNSSTDIITGVTWNSVAMQVLYSAADTDTEPGLVKAYFLDNVTNGVITVSRTNNTVVTVGYAASISALGACIVSQTFTQADATTNTNASSTGTGTAASGEVSVNDNSPGTSSMRFAAAYTGSATPLGAGTNSTALQNLDSTSFGSSFVRETTAGQGARSVGFATGTTDDYALVAVAVSEKINTNPQPTAASLTASGATPAVVLNTISLPTAASLTASGATPTVVVTNNVTSQPTAASLTASGATPDVKTPVVSQPTAAALTATGAVPDVSASAAVNPQPTAASLALTGATPDVATPVLSLPTVAALSVTGATPAVATPISVNPSALALALTPATPSVGIGVSSLPTAASLSLTGATPTVAVTQNVLVQPAALALAIAFATPAVVVTGQTPSVNPGYPLTGGSGPGLSAFVLGELQAAEERAREEERRRAQADLDEATARQQEATAALNRQYEEEWLLFDIGSPR